MSRYAKSQNIAAAACDAVVAKEKTYRQSIKENIALADIAAARLSPESDLTHTLASMVESIGDDSVFSREQVDSFMAQQRDRLKRIAQSNVENDRLVDVFVASVKALKEIEIQKFDSQDAKEEEKDSDPGQRLHDIFSEKKKEMENGNIQLHQEEHYRTVLERMGEKVGARDDDDIEMIQNSASQRGALICPVLRTLMVDPVKSKVCQHTYSREGIFSQLKAAKQRRRGCACPVSGCSNSNVTEDQLESDLLVAHEVKREIRRLEHLKELQASQASQANDLDLEED